MYSERENIIRNFCRESLLLLLSEAKKKKEVDVKNIPDTTGKYINITMISSLARVDSNFWACALGVSLYFSPAAVNLCAEFD